MPRLDTVLLRIERDSMVLNSIRWPSSACSASAARRAMPTGPDGRMGKSVWGLAAVLIFAISSPLMTQRYACLGGSSSFIFMLRRLASLPEAVVVRRRGAGGRSQLRLILRYDPQVSCAATPC